ncbi:MAG: L7Ae/L30e/S12e/Gadd45 family ribosomal protein [Christensenellales bacterium]
MSATRFTRCWASPCARGSWSLGESGVLKTVSSGTALFMILDADASDNTKKKFRDSCAFYKVPLYETSPDRLGQAIGKPGRMSAAIARGTLGEKLLALAREEEAGNAPFQGR